MNLTNVSQTLRLREYYYMILRHQIVFMAAVLIAISGAGFLAVTLPKIYRAETTLLIEDEKLLNPLISGLAISPSVQARLRTLREELLSWQRLTLLVEKLGLNKDTKNPLAFERLIKSLRDSIAVKMRGSSLISVSYEGVDPKKAQEIVETLATIIVEGNMTSVTLEANSAIQFIQDQMEPTAF
ncbi:MAG: hypothetical protein NC930_09615, partial [Candidatus Omnitrophica bacterium]|nr:hypothetical protein [Candidatus Omnitrophota bacterium]